MNEDQAERLRNAAGVLAKAENDLIRIRKKYSAALRAWEACAQVKLDLDKK